MKQKAPSRKAAATRRIPSHKELLKKGVPAILIPGIIFAAIYGNRMITTIKNYYTEKRLFPSNGIVQKVEDGDTMVLSSGQRVRLIGINSPERGKTGYEEAKQWLNNSLTTKKVWLEYDRYQDDKYGRNLAWVWIGCEDTNPKFLPANYMHLSGNESRDYITDKAEGCRKGTLINKELVDKGLARAVEYGKRGRLKYRM